MRRSPLTRRRAAPARRLEVLARRLRTDDGATAIEWAIFALLALAVAGMVAGAITLAIQNRLPGIQ